MTASVNNNATSQAQLLQMLQQLASQNSLATDLDNQDPASADTSAVTPGAPGLTGGSPAVSGDLLSVLMQAQGETTATGSIPASGSYTNQSAFGQGFQQLVQAIQSGDLSGAQQAYSTLSQDMNNQVGPPANPDSPFMTALNQIGSDLQSGDLTGAQQTLTAMQEAHHHHGGGGDTAGLPDSADGSTSSSATGSSSTPGTVTEVNADGTITTITTNPDGTITTTTTPPPNQSASGSSSPTLQDLLAALEQLGAV